MSGKLRWDLRAYCKVHGILGIGRDSNGEFSMTTFCPDCGSDKTTETFGPVAALQAKLSAVQAGAEGFTFADAVAMVRGARDIYSGGYHDEKELAAFKHGLDTAFAVLDQAAKNDTQTVANLNIGRGALAQACPECKGKGNGGAD